MIHLTGPQIWKRPNRNIHWKMVRKKKKIWSLSSSKNKWPLAEQGLSQTFLFSSQAAQSVFIPPRIISQCHNSATFYKHLTMPAKFTKPSEPAWYFPHQVKSLTVMKENFLRCFFVFLSDKGPRYILIVGLVFFFNIPCSIKFTLVKRAIQLILEYSQRCPTSSTI